MEPIHGFLFIEPFYNLAFNILVVFYRALGGNLGLAIIVFTLALKFLTLPFSIRQVNSAKKNTEFQAKYKEIKNKYKNSKDREKETQELARLQSEYLPSQLGGCLPMIIQLLFFFQVYYVIINILNVGPAAFNVINYSFIPEFAAGTVLDLNFLGMNLGKSASTIGFGNFGAVLPYLILVFLVGFSQFISSRVSSGLSALPKFGKGEETTDKAADVQTKKKKDKKVKDKDQKVPEDMSFSDAMQQSSKTMLYTLPLMTMFLSLSFPAGLSLYWTVTSGFAIIQQLIVHKDKVVVRLKKLLTKN